MENQKLESDLHILSQLNTKEEIVIQKDSKNGLIINSDFLRHLQIGIAFFAFTAIGGNDGALGVLLPSIRNYYEVDKATVGWLFISGAIGYLIAALSSGAIAQKLGECRFLLLGATSFLLGAVGFSIKPPFILLLIVPLLLGFGAAIMEAGLNCYIAKLPHNTALLNYLHAFYGIGALVGPVVASTILATNLSWNSTYFVWMGMSSVLLVSFGFFFNQPRLFTQEQQAEASGNVMVNVLNLRIVWLAALFLFFYVGTELSLGNWSYSFLIEERHENEFLSGWIVSGYWMGLTVGRLVLAKVSEKIEGKHLIHGCMAGVAVGVLLIWSIPLSATEATGLWLTGFSLGPIFPTTIALISNMLPNYLLLSAIGFIASLGNMGTSLFPWLAGNLAEGIGLWSLLPYVIALTFGMLCFWLALHTCPKTISSDSKKPVTLAALEVSQQQEVL